MPDLTPEQHYDLVEAAKARDHRLSLIEQSLDIETELRDSPTWRYVMQRAEDERAEAIAGLAVADVEDIKAMRALQRKAALVDDIRKWLDELYHAGRALEHEIAIEDGVLPPDA